MRSIIKVSLNRMDMFVKKRRPQDTGPIRECLLGFHPSRYLGIYHGPVIQPNDALIFRRQNSAFSPIPCNGVEIAQAR